MARPHGWRKTDGWVEIAVAIAVLAVVLWLFATNVNKPRLLDEPGRGGR